ncbi:MAG: ComEC/Rec2 family competence protein [Chitinophagaceae bacterium]
MQRPTLYLWKQAPFLRLVIPLMAGIALQWYLLLPTWLAWVILSVGILFLIFFNLRSIAARYSLQWVNGICINSMLLALGMLLTKEHNSSYQSNWLKNRYKVNDVVIATLQEPLSEKTNSFKANASVQLLLRGENTIPVKGNIIIYFKKDSSLQNLSYGSQLIFSRQLQPIKNSGNPGAFDYERYCAFQGIYQQVFLDNGNYVVLPVKNQSRLQQLLFAIREKVLHIITTYIPGEKEAGLAEALLVGYKDDLDKTLVQSYSNTGVVHVIAISGMHLGLIYWLLSLLVKPLQKKKYSSWIAPLIIISGLWLFALLAGGGPSILRSAVMFTCIVIGQGLKRKTNIYNSLAASAFVLLCINPFWLWDVGFQLSYIAVLSIVIFMKPIYDWFYFSNKLIDTVWKLMAVTIAAQVLTTPISIYHFHQFPVYFLITNLLAVPLSSLIIFLEIVLCAVAAIPFVAKPIGIVLHWLIYLLNRFIEHMESLPFSLWNGLQINTPQTIFLYGSIAAIAFWLMRKNKPAFVTGLCCLLCFFAIRSYDFIKVNQQKELIVYNVPKRQAIDFIDGRKYAFRGSEDLLEDDFLQNFHLKPSRILHRIQAVDSLITLTQHGPFFIFNGRKIMIADKHTNPSFISADLQPDLLIITGNAPAQPALLEKVHCRELILDGSISTGKVHKWKAAAANLGLACFSVVDNGAFVMKVD